MHRCARCAWYWFSLGSAALANSLSCNFTCHHRRFELRGEEADMACGSGLIGPSLRNRSSVHYWRAGSQSRAKREALCTKEAARRWHLVTFGSHGKYEANAKALCEMAMAVPGALDSCTPFSAASEGVLSSADRARLRIGPKIEAFGWWKWKPCARSTLETRCRPSPRRRTPAASPLWPFHPDPRVPAGITS